MSHSPIATVRSAIASSPSTRVEAFNSRELSDETESMTDDPSQDTILETRNMTRAFSGFVAVQDVSLRVARGSIHALIGPNGAGKTTCFNLLTKFLQPSAGRIFFNGEDITRSNPVQVARRGLVRSFQISAVFPHLNLRENVRLALQRRLGTTYHFWKSGRSLNPLDMHALELLDEVGLASYADEQAGNLSYGRKRALEIATTLAADPELMLLDEPTQGMGHEDVGRVTALIKRVSAGRTVLMVEHNMSVISKIADTVTVLQRGKVIAEGSYQAVSRDQRVTEAYMGMPAEAL